LGALSLAEGIEDRMKKSTLSAIQKGLRHSEQGRSRRSSAFFLTPASSSKLKRLFYNECRSNGFGTPLLSKKAENMLSGFIRLGRNNGWEEKKFYDTIIDLVKYWKEIKHKDHYSLNGKRVLLGDRPSLMEFLIARDSVLTAIESVKCKVDCKPLQQEQESVVAKRRRKTFGPTEEEMQREYEEQMEKLMGG